MLQADPSRWPHAKRLSVTYREIRPSTICGCCVGSFPHFVVPIDQGGLTQSVPGDPVVLGFHAQRGLSACERFDDTNNS